MAMPSLPWPSRLLPASLTRLAVPKNRRLKFDLHLKIIDLNNVPYVTGKSFVNWHLSHSNAAEDRGRTDKCSIKEHRIQYNYEKTVAVRLTIDKTGMLQESHIRFEIFHEVLSGDKSDRIPLGRLKLNLAEYVWASEQEGEETVNRRYLMQDSKINSTLKVGLFMKQTEGDHNYVAPPLKSAAVFGGIAGIMAGERGDSEDAGQGLPTLDNKSREADEQLKELYRRTLAADWTCQPGEMSADKTIEDIFAGGDGWGNAAENQDEGTHSDRLMPGDDGGSLSDSETRALKGNKHRNWSGFFSRRHQKQRSVPERIDKEEVLHVRDAAPGIRGRGVFEQQISEMKSDSEKRRSRQAHELDEFDVREDLRCWNLPA